MNRLSSISFSVFYIALLAVILLPQTEAAIFDVGVIVCDNDWYCTNYSQGTCGTRTCIDAAACGTNWNKPAEYLACPPVVPDDDDGGSGGGGGGGGSPIFVIPAGYFTLNLDILKIDVPQDTVVQKILKINGSEPGDYTLEILYPSSYTKGTNFVTTSISSKHIENSGDFNIVIDTRSILVGTYSIPISVSNGRYTKTINAVIDVTPKKNIQMEVTLDTNVKNLGIDNELKVYTRIRGLDIKGNEIIAYNILDPAGNIILSQEKPLNSSQDIEETIIMPRTIDEGYYTLSVKVLQDADEYIKSATFTVLPLQRYALIKEEPKPAMIKSQLILGIITVTIALIVLINIATAYRAKSQRKYVNKKYTSFASTPNKGSVLANMTFGLGKGISSLFSSGEAKEKSPEKRLEVLKNTYDKGFISIVEYRNALREAGYLAESNKVWEEYNAAQRKLKEGQTAEKLAVVKEPAKAPVEPIKPAPVKEKTEDKTGILGKIEGAFKKEEEKVKEMLHETKAPEHPAPKPAGHTEASVLETTEKIISGALTHMFVQSPLDKRAPEHTEFVLHGNERLYCIRDLLNVLPKMPEHVFAHHTMHGRNDFADWIGDVFGYHDLAEEVRTMKSKEGMILTLKKYE